MKEDPLHHSPIAKSLEQWQETTAEQTALNSLAVGDVVHSKYRVISKVSADRFKVVHVETSALFELRRVATLCHTSRAWRRLEIVTESASVVANENLGFIADYGVCPSYGGYVVGEWVEGQQLTTILSKGEQHTLEYVLQFVLEIGHALQTLHDIGLAHGLLDSDDVIYDSKGVWHLLMPGVPPRCANVGAAPELNYFYAATAASDQFALSFLTWSLLVGTAPDLPIAFGPSELRADSPEGLDKALLQALDVDPKKRWKSIDLLQRCVHTEVSEWRKPIIESFDAREASRSLRALPSAATDAPESFDRSGPSSRSVVVRVSDIRSEAVRLEFTFNTIGRIRREFRRNIVTGSLFIPTTEVLEIGRDVQITLNYSPTGQAVELLGKVEQVEVAAEGRPPGLGIRFDKSSHHAAMRFVHDVDPFATMSPEDVVCPNPTPNLSETLSASEAFVLGRLTHPMPLGQIRGLFLGMLFDVDEIVTSLIDAGFLEVRGSQKPQVREHSGIVPRRVLTSKRANAVIESLEDGDVTEVLERVSEFQKVGNCRAAYQLLESALQTREDHRILFQLASITSRFMRDFSSAIRHIDRALSLAPGNVEYEGFRKWVLQVHGHETVSVVFKATKKDGSFRHVYAADGRVWVEFEGRSSEKRFFVFDTLKKSLSKVSKSSSNAKSMNVEFVENSTPLFSYYDGPPVFEWTQDAPTFVLTTSNLAGEKGLFLAQSGFKAPQSLLTGEMDWLRPVFAPDSTGTVAYVGVDQSINLWLCSPGKRPRRSMDLDSYAFLAWSYDSKTVFAVEEQSGTITAINAEFLSVSFFGFVPPNVYAFAVDGENMTALVLSGRSKGGSILTWFSLNPQDFKILASWEIEETPINAILRGDGKTVLQTRNGIMVYCLKNGVTVHSSLSVGKEVFETGKWRLGRSLFVILKEKEKLTICEINPQ